jgi:hypothetical protein
MRILLARMQAHIAAVLLCLGLSLVAVLGASDFVRGRGPSRAGIPPLISAETRTWHTQLL